LPPLEAKFHRAAARISCSGGAAAIPSRERRILAETSQPAHLRRGMKNG